MDYARIYKQAECIDLLLANCAVGMSVEGIPPVSIAVKVCFAVTISALLDVYNTSLTPLSYVVFFTFQKDNADFGKEAKDSR